VWCLCPVFALSYHLPVLTAYDDPQLVCHNWYKLIALIFTATMANLSTIVIPPTAASIGYARFIVLQSVLGWQKVDFVNLS
jgi:hypothetical protein